MRKAVSSKQKPEQQELRGGEQEVRGGEQAVRGGCGREG